MCGFASRFSAIGSLTLLHAAIITLNNSVLYDL